MTDGIPSDSRFSRQLLGLRRSTGYIVILTASAGLLLLVLISPLLLRILAGARGIDWPQLSNIGQTYGAASAILSGVALIGVSLSLLIQARQARAERIQVVRERHMDILRIALEDPEVYARVMGMDAESLGENTRAFIFATILMNYGRMGYQMGVLTESAIRADFFQGLFQSELGRAWWSQNRQLWIRNPVPERRAQQFVRIADDEYHKAIMAGPPTITVPSKDSPHAIAKTPQHRSQWHTPTAIALGITVGIMIRSRILGGRGRAH
jgi:hypothetical protein